MHSRHPFTTHIYHMMWRAFLKWPRHRQVLGETTSIPDLLVFLQEGLQQGFKTYTPKQQVVAISSIILIIIIISD